MRANYGKRKNERTEERRQIAEDRGQTTEADILRITYNK